ncbi:hypothetical protein JCM3770_005877 [Rhodotorula araucariae]
MLTPIDPCTPTDDRTSESETRTAHRDSAPRLVTPPASPRPAARGQTFSVSDFVREQIQYTPPKLGSARDEPSGSPLSPCAPTFNPVVGSTSTTPIRPERPFKPFSFSDHDLLVRSASNPATPQRFSASQPWSLTPDRVDLEPAPQPWTWPPRVTKPGDALKLRYGSPAAPSQDSSPPRFDKDTPTKSGRIATPLVHSPLKQVFQHATFKLATRYVLVEGLRKDLTEADLRGLLLPRCEGLSVRGCFTARLRDYGEIVLLFHDVRHAIAAARLVQLDESGLMSTLQAQALLSPSEAVLVFTLRGPTATPYFTPVSLLASFGEIRTIKMVEEHFHVVEYWDDRSAQQAYKSLKGCETGGARFDCSFEPVVASTDLPTWTQSAATPSGRSVAPAASLFPPTPVATPIAPSPPFASSFTPIVEPWQSASHTYAPALRSAAAVVDEIGFDPLFSDARTVAPADSHFGSQQHHADPAPPPASTAAPIDLHHFPPPHSNCAVPPTQSSAPSWCAIRRSRIGQDYGIVRDDRIPAGNLLNFQRIERGLDVRTTVMIKNIPNKLKDVEVMEIIEEVVGRAFDFFYLRCDYSNDCNVGYGFCNFTSTAALLAFAKARLGTRWDRCGSDKLVVVSYANIQGKASLVSHFRNSSVLDQDECRRPKLFVTSGPRAGEPEPFPSSE